MDEGLFFFFGSDFIVCFGLYNRFCISIIIYTFDLLLNSISSLRIKIVKKNNNNKKRILIFDGFQRIFLLAKSPLNISNEIVCWKIISNLCFNKNKK